MKRMSMKKFGRIVASVMESLPPEFEPHLHNVVVDIEEEPSVELLRKAGLSEEEIAAGETLLGLFDPFEVSNGDFIDPDLMLHRLFIFKNPHEDEFPDPDELVKQIRKTVIHELAHHFGYTDRDLERWTSVY
jgi:predicted Zn-dependent protease with MMP-like domain